jgi:hypothetical protein
MTFAIAAVASLFTYLILMQLLFDSFEECRKKVRSLVEYIPISVVADWAFGRDSLRSWVWMMSGPLVGVVVYSVISR